jgi:hypothetical protein
MSSCKLFFLGTVARVRMPRRKQASDFSRSPSSQAQSGCRASGGGNRRGKREIVPLVQLGATADVPQRIVHKDVPELGYLGLCANKLHLLTYCE